MRGDIERRWHIAGYTVLGRWLALLVLTVFGKEVISESFEDFEGTKLEKLEQIFAVVYLPSYSRYTRSNNPLPALPREPSKFPLPHFSL